MTNLDQLYKSMILEHNKNPRNFCKVDPHTHYAHGHNPLCGDDYEVYLRLNDDIIEEIGFIGEGCAISKASGSMMSQVLKGKTLEESLEMKDLFLALVTQDGADSKALGKLAVFEGVKRFPVRVKCAALVWRALEAALESKEVESKITTE